MHTGTLLSHSEVDSADHRLDKDTVEAGLATAEDRDRVTAVEVLLVDTLSKGREAVSVISTNTLNHASH